MNEISRHSITLLTGYDRRDVVDALRESGFVIDRVIVPKSPKYLKNLGIFLVYLFEQGIPVDCVEPKSGLLELPGDANGVLMSVGYPFFIPGAVCDRFGFALNVHPTLLPRHRGKYLHYVLLEDDDYSGSTVHFITDSLDAGPIVAQSRFPVSKFETLASLTRKSRALEPHLILRALQLLEEPNPKSVPQDESLQCTHLLPRSPEDSYMDSGLSLMEALNVVRASDWELYPAYFEVDGHRVYVKMERRSKKSDEIDQI
jgi:methionyl-tRNA formyltransferase